MNFIEIVFASILANNLLFFHYLGVSEFLASAGQWSLFRKTLLLWVLLSLAVVLYWVPDQFLLQPLHWEFLRTLLLLGVLGLVSFAYSASVRSFKGSWPQAKEYLVHSFLIGGVLLVGASSSNLLEILLLALAVVLGYGIALLLLNSVLSRLSRERIPPFIQGLPLKLMTLGLVWLVLQGLGFSFLEKG